MDHFNICIDFTHVMDAQRAWKAATTDEESLKAYHNLLDEQAKALDTVRKRMRYKLGTN